MRVTSKRSYLWTVRAILTVSLMMLIFSLPVPGWAQAKSQVSPEPGGHARDRQVLERGKTIERTLAVGEVHSYEMVLPAGQYVSAVIEKDGVAVVATLFGPDGRKIDVFGTSASRQGSEPIRFATQTSGTYRIDVRTFFKPAPPGRYRVKVAELRAATDEDWSRLAGQRCEEKNWMDRENNFQVNLILNSITECMSAVGRRLGTEHPKAAGIAEGTSSEVGFLVSRWQWGEFVSAAYQESLILDFKMLAHAAKERNKKKAYAIMGEVADDLKIKADHCRNSTRGLGKDVTVKVATKKENTVDPGWQIYYKFRIHEFTEGYDRQRFSNLSSPAIQELPPGLYIIWAVKPGKPESKKDIVKVGEGKEVVDLDLLVP
jgi:hypothetical protein